MQIIENPEIPTRIRLLETDDEERFFSHIKEKGLDFAKRYMRTHLDQQNLILNGPYQTQANFYAGLQAPWENMKWYAQAIGTSTLTPAASQKGLNYEAFRRQFSDFSPTVSNPTGRVVTMNTFFGTSDYSNWSSTVSAATAPTSTTFSVAAPSGVPISTSFPVTAGDLIQIQLPTQFEFKEVLSVVGNLITLTSPLVSGLPVTGAVVSQCTEEIGFFGNAPAGYITGTVALTNGSPTVTGTGTAFSTSNVMLINPLDGTPGRIRFPGSTQPRTWYNLSSINSGTSLTLTANFTGTTAAAQPYILEGTGFNRINLVRYVKPPTRAFVVENQWTPGG